jgi:hypothetical protein
MESDLLQGTQGTEGAPLGALGRFVGCGLDVQGLSGERYDAAVHGEMVEGWRLAPRRRGRMQFTAPMPLPPLGVVVLRDGEAVGALWLFEAIGAPVAWFECAVTRPNLTAREAKRVLLFALALLMEMAGKCWEPPGEYRIFLGHVLPEAESALKAMGFVFGPPGRFCGIVQ